MDRSRPGSAPLCTSPERSWTNNRSSAPHRLPGPYKDTKTVTETEHVIPNHSPFRNLSYKLKLKDVLLVYVAVVIQEQLQRCGPQALSCRSQHQLILATAWCWAHLYKACRRSAAPASGSILGALGHAEPAKANRKRVGSPTLFL